MTWAEHADRAGRTPAWMVEVDLDWIADGSVVATNPDGTLCYRTPATTVQGSFTVGVKTRRWISSNVRPMPELPAIPCISAVSISAEELRIGKGLGLFGQISISLIDFTDDDRRAEDPFVTDSSRTGLNLSAGTYLTKLLARNPYWSNRPIRITEGWATDGIWHPTDTITHYFFVRDVQGPSDGQMKITAAGPLQLTNLSEAEVPATSEGVLAADITNAATSATIADPVIAATYPASGVCRMGDEVMNFSRSGQALTLTRARYNTIADAHSQDDSIQLCAVYLNQDLVVILQDLLVTYAGVSSSLLDLAGWAIEQAAWLHNYVLSGVISQPTKVLDVARELLEASGAVLWWDDQTSLVRLRAIRPALTSAAHWTDAHHLLKPPMVKTDMAERVSRCDVCIDLRSADQDANKASSYRARVIGVSKGAGPTEHQKEKLKLIASRWLASNQASLAVRASYLITDQLRNGRRTIVAEVPARSAARQLGDVVTIQSRDIVDRTGAVANVRTMVIKRETTALGSRYRYTLERLNDANRFAFLCPVGLPNYSSASDAQRDPGWFLAPANHGPFDADNPAYVLG